MGLYYNIKKYKFIVTYIKFLGFIININNIKVNLEKIIVIIN
jgi:hypothetical protein